MTIQLTAVHADRIYWGLRPQQLELWPLPPQQDCKTTKQTKTDQLTDSPPWHSSLLVLKPAFPLTNWQMEYRRQPRWQAFIMESCQPARPKRKGGGKGRGFLQRDVSCTLGWSQDNLVRKYDTDGLWHLLMTQCSCCITACHKQLIRNLQLLHRKTKLHKIKCDDERGK